MARNAQSVIAQERPPHPAPAGVIVFKRTDKGIVGFEHSCPCGCGGWTFIRLNPENWAPGPYHWHGFLRNGMFEEC